MTERNYLPPPLDEMKHVTCICHLAWPVALFLVVRSVRIVTTTVSVMTELIYLPPPLDEMKHVTCICHLAWPIALFLVVRSVRIVTTTIVIILQWVANPQNFCSLP